MQKGSKKKNWKVSVLLTVITVIAIGVLIFCAYQLVPKLIEYKVSDDTFGRIRNDAVQELDAEEVAALDSTISSEESSENDLGPADLTNALKIDWDAFADTEIVAWIQLDDISYPVMQGDDNDKYLHHLPDGSYNYGGSIFLYNHNNPLFTDQSSFVYGHNMSNGSMFGNLDRYTDESYKDSKFYIYLPDGTRRTYRFYSVASVGESSDTYTWSFASDDSFLEWQEMMREASMYDTGLEPSTDAMYVTLSTCNGYAGTSYRLVVCGQLERVDTLQEPASWYDAYLEQYSTQMTAKEEQAMAVRETLDTLVLQRQSEVYEERMGSAASEEAIMVQEEE